MHLDRIETGDQRRAHTVQVSLRGAAVGYADRTVLREVDLDIGSGEAVAILGPNGALLAVLAEEARHAPALLDFEVASALRGHVLGGLLDHDRLDDAVRSFAALRIERHPMTGMLREILALRANFTARQLHCVRRRVRRPRPGTGCGDRHL